MYYPKNKIETNLHASENQFVIKDTKKPYIGSYWKTFEGKFFTGKNPDVKPSTELIVFNSTDMNLIEGERNVKIAYLDSPAPFNGVNYDENMVYEYAQINKVEILNFDVKKLPLTHHPLPTPEDYDLGYIERYFTVKVNESRFKEVNLETYKKIESSNSNWQHELFIVFSITWILTGDKRKATISNFNTVERMEQRLNKYGLKSYLQSNYSLFYK